MNHKSTPSLPDKEIVDEIYRDAYDDGYEDAGDERINHYLTCLALALSTVFLLQTVFAQVNAYTLANCAVGM